jgi:hypothetical protein
LAELGAGEVGFDVVGAGFTVVGLAVVGTPVGLLVGRRVVGLAVGKFVGAAEEGFELVGAKEVGEAVTGAAVLLEEHPTVVLI